MTIMKTHASRSLAAPGSALVNYSSDSSSESDSELSPDDHPQSHAAAVDPNANNISPQDRNRDRDRPAAGIPLLRPPDTTTTAPNGQWPIHVHVPLGPLPTRLADLIDKLVAHARHSIPDLTSLLPSPSTASSSPASPPHQLHISLSRAGTWLPRSQLAACVGMIQADLAHQRPVQVQLGRVAHLVNDTGSRRFLVLECTAGQVGLARWVRGVDRVLERQLGRRPFYDKPKFHVSIGYVDLSERANGSEDGRDPDGARWDEVTAKLTTEYGPELAGCVLKLDRIEMRTGERVYEVAMSD